jgi:hypothetical protein
VIGELNQGPPWARTPPELQENGDPRFCSKMSVLTLSNVFRPFVLVVVPP